MHRKKAYLLLHIMLLLYAISSIFSKLAAGEDFLSFRFVLYYGAALVLLAVYALGWQQVIKRLPLTTAYASKAVTVIWGLAAGMLLFGEKLSPGKIIGAGLVIAGVILFAFGDQPEESTQSEMKAAAHGAAASQKTTAKTRCSKGDNTP